MAPVATDATGMKAEADFAALQDRLLAKAKTLGAARVASLAARRSPAKWRDAALLWPLFGKD